MSIYSLQVFRHIIIYIKKAYVQMHTYNIHAYMHIYLHLHLNQHQHQHLHLYLITLFQLSMYNMYQFKVQNMRYCFYIHILVQVQEIFTKKEENMSKSIITITSAISGSYTNNASLMEVERCGTWEQDQELSMQYGQYTFYIPTLHQCEYQGCW